MPGSRGNQRIKCYALTCYQTFRAHVWLKDLKYDIKYDVKNSYLDIDWSLPSKHWHQTGRKQDFIHRAFTCVSEQHPTFNTSNEVGCVLLLSQDKHYTVAFQIQEDILGQPAKVWRLQRKLIYEPFPIWLVCFRAEEKHCKPLMFEQASSCTLCSFTIFLDLWVTKTRPNIR